METTKSHFQLLAAHREPLPRTLRALPAWPESREASLSRGEVSGGEIDASCHLLTCTLGQVAVHLGRRSQSAITPAKRSTRLVTEQIHLTLNFSRDPSGMVAVKSRKKFLVFFFLLIVEMSFQCPRFPSSYSTVTAVP